MLLARLIRVLDEFEIPPLLRRQRFEESARIGRRHRFNIAVVVLNDDAALVQ